MPFPKGVPRAPGAGRKKGVPNKLTSERKQRLAKVLDMLDEKIENDLKRMQPKERALIWKEIQEFFLPKLQRTEGSISITDLPCPIIK